MLERFLSKKLKTGEMSSELNDGSVQDEMQPSLQTTPATDTSPPSTSQESACNDYNKAQTPKEFSYAMKTLTMSQKYHLLTISKEHLKEKAFSTQYLAGCNRSFRLEWLSQHPWMMYSECVDGVFCTACAIFCSDASKSNFVTKPFQKWNKKSKKAKEHKHSTHHPKAMEQAYNLKQAVERPHTAISAQIDSSKTANIERNHEVPKSIARAMLFCGRQCIALRGDVENLDTPENPGNFLALLKLLAVHDSVLKSHLETPAMRCVTHLSPQTQNELIEVMGKHIILKGILDDLNAATYYSILADEVTSHNEEHLAICARFIDEKKDVREEFLTFIKLERG